MTCFKSLQLQLNQSFIVSFANHFSMNAILCCPHTVLLTRTEVESCEQLRNKSSQCNLLFVSRYLYLYTKQNTIIFSSWQQLHYSNKYLWIYGSAFAKYQPLYIVGTWHLCLFPVQVFSKVICPPQIASSHCAMYLAATLLTPNRC